MNKILSKSRHLSVLGVFLLSLVLQMLSAMPFSSLSFVPVVDAADTGFANPSAEGTNHNNWTNGGNAYSSNDVYATESSEEDDQSYENFGFSVPNGATIDGIEVRVEAKSSDTVGCQLEVRMRSVSDNEHTDVKAQSLNGSDTVYTLGSASDLRGSTWIGTDFTNANFHVEVEFDDVSGSSCGLTTVSLDHIQVKVHYTEAAPADAEVVYGVCLQDTSLNCTANDTSLAQPSIAIINNDDCDFPGDTATVALYATIEPNTDRYDFGVWVSTDGDPDNNGSLSGQCAVAILGAPQPGLDDGDICGDVNSAGLSGAYLGTVTIPCADADNDGFINVPVVTSWKQSSNSNDCSEPHDAIPGTSSKCEIQNDFAIPVPVPGQIIINKQTNINGAVGSFPFTISGPSVNTGFNLSDNGQWKSGINGPVLFSGTYTITESVPGGWSLGTISCTSQDGSVIGNTTNGKTITLKPGDIVECTFNNNADPVCGDGIVNGNDECDDDNSVNGDGCENDCTFTCSTNADCTDNNICNGAETCNQTTHMCENGTAPVVDDGLFCTVDSCDPQGGVSHTPISVDDGLFCTVDSCDEANNEIDHNPISVDDGLFCTVDSCDEGQNVIVHAPIDVSDGLFCTNDSCDEEINAIVHTPISVDDQNLCTTDSCDEENNEIDHVAVNTDDNNACTIDTCSPSVGVIHTPVSTDDQNVCTTDSCDPEEGVIHTPISTDDSDACTADSCDPEMGIEHEFICECQTDEDCGDQNVCNGDETCNEAGSCVDGTDLDIDDDDVCTADSCDEIDGAVHTIIDADQDGIADCRDNCVGTYNPDQADLDSDGIGDACDEPDCGNGFQEANEECDDGANGNSTDGCNDQCQDSVNGVCGSDDGSSYYAADGYGNALSSDSEGLCLNGTTPANFTYNDEAHTWTWDCVGINGGSTAACTATETYCGDDLWDADKQEQCDDGNTTDGDGCSEVCTHETPECTITAIPLNGIVPLNVSFDLTYPAWATATFAPGDGNSFDNPGDMNYIYGTAGYYLATLNLVSSFNENIIGSCELGISGFPGCGNGMIEGQQYFDRILQVVGDGDGDGDGDPYYYEECDDGNENNNDACSNECTNNYCGDGIVNNGEQCDAGEEESSTCTSECTTIRRGGGGGGSSITCGNGTINIGEECDDSNTTNGDGCNASCRIEETNISTTVTELLETGALKPKTKAKPFEYQPIILPAILPKTGGEMCIATF